MKHETYMKTFEASRTVLQVMNGAVLRQHPEIVLELKKVLEAVREVRQSEEVEEIRA